MWARARGFDALPTGPAPSSPHLDDDGLALLGLDAQLVALKGGEEGTGVGAGGRPWRRRAPRRRQGRLGSETTRAMWRSTTSTTLHAPARPRRRARQRRIAAPPQSLSHRGKHESLGVGLLAAAGGGHGGRGPGVGRGVKRARARALACH